MKCRQVLSTLKRVLNKNNKVTTAMLSLLQTNKMSQEEGARVTMTETIATIKTQANTQK